MKLELSFRYATQQPTLAVAAHHSKARSTPPRSNGETGLCVDGGGGRRSAGSGAPAFFLFTSLFSFTDARRTHHTRQRKRESGKGVAGGFGGDSATDNRCVRLILSERWTAKARHTLVGEPRALLPHVAPYLV
jgi:hypothetical protein